MQKGSGAVKSGMKTCNHCGGDMSHLAAQARYCRPICRTRASYQRTGKDWHKKNPEKAAAKAKRWCNRYPEKAKVNSASWAKNHPEENRKRVRAWQLKNPEKAARLRNRYAKAVARATPQWLSEQDLFFIDQYYIIAAETQAITGVPMHVDHLVPIQGKNVCGLHVPWNLRPIEASVNIRKGNRAL